MLRILGLVGGFAFGRAFPALGILLGAPLLLLSLLGAALRFWPVTLAVCGLLLLNYLYNTSGPPYVPPTAAEMAAGVRQPLPPGAEKPRHGALLEARNAVRREVDATAAVGSWPQGGFMQIRVSLRNPSAYATLAVEAVRCSVRTRDSQEGKRSPAPGTVPPGGAFEHRLQVRYPYPGHSATGVECDIDDEVVLP